LPLNRSHTYICTNNVNVDFIKVILCSKDIKSIGAELAKILIDMTDEEKAVAFAMMKGMVVGKQIAEQQKTA
jgi:hypothetical protein